MQKQTITNLEELRDFINAGYLSPFEKEKLIELGKLCKFSHEVIEVDVEGGKIINFTYKSI